jgi:hypothetical protein
MKYPSLVPDRVCKTRIRIVIDRDELNEDGDPVEAFSADLRCNWQDRARTILTTEQKYIRITGIALFNGDICPELPVIASGYGIIFGERRTICDGIKARNPDGTVNYTEVRFQ